MVGKKDTLKVRPASHLCTHEPQHTRVWEEAKKLRGLLPDLYVGPRASFAYALVESASKGQHSGRCCNAV